MCYLLLTDHFSLFFLAVLNEQMKEAEGSPTEYEKEIEELKPEDINFEPEIHSYQIKKEELLALVGNKNGMPPVVQLELNWNE